MRSRWFDYAVIAACSFVFLFIFFVVLTSNWV